MSSKFLTIIVLLPTNLFRPVPLKYLLIFLFLLVLLKCNFSSYCFLFMTFFLLYKFLLIVRLFNVWSIRRGVFNWVLIMERRGVFNWVLIMVQVKCSCCGNDVDQHKMVTCCICKQLFSFLCVKLTQSEARAINTNKNLNWTCSKCLPLGVDIAALKEVVIKLQKEIAELKNQKAHETPMNFEFEDILYEIREREKRKCNIIIHGVKEEAIQNREERQSLDQQVVSSIFTALPVEVEITKITRLGAFDPSRPRSRPIRVVLKDEDSVYKILKKKRGLRNTVQYSTVNISTDRTSKEIAYYKKVKDEMERRKNDGEDNLRIKYIKGIPKIVALN